MPESESHGQPLTTNHTRFAEIARNLFAEPLVAPTLQRIVAAAVETIEGCDGAGVLLLTNGEIEAGAWSNELARSIEEMKCEVREGPCVDAIFQRATFESADLRDELSRWPTFAARALDAGVESMLAFRLFAAEETLGALDLYSTRRGAFDETARALGNVFAAHAALALAGAQIRERHLVARDTLREALVNRDLIGQAKGILMATRHIDADAAFDLLRATSQDLNVKLHMIAERVVFTGTLPEP
jgi:transcriptional regulator with GAF, ATPase, and Fis domain